MEIFKNSLSFRNLVLDIERGEDAFDYLLLRLSGRQRQDLDDTASRLATLYVGKTLAGVKVTPDLYRFLLTRAVNRFYKQKTVLFDSAESPDNGEELSGGEKSLFEVLSGILQLELIGYSNFSAAGNTPDYRTTMDQIYKSHFNGDFISEGENFAENMAEIHQGTFNARRNKFNLNPIIDNVSTNLARAAARAAAQNTVPITQPNTGQGGNTGRPNNTGQGNINPRVNPNHNTPIATERTVHSPYYVTALVFAVGLTGSILVAVQDYVNRHPEVKDKDIETIKPDSRYNKILNSGLIVTTMLSLGVYYGLSLQRRENNSRRTRSFLLTSENRANSIELSSRAASSETPSREQSADALLARFTNNSIGSSSQNRANSENRGIVMDSRTRRENSNMAPSTSVRL